MIAQTGTIDSLNSLILLVLKCTKIRGNANVEIWKCGNVKIQMWKYENVKMWKWQFDNFNNAFLWPIIILWQGFNY